MTDSLGSMVPDPSPDPPFDSNGLKFAFGEAFFGAVATSIAIATEEILAKRVPALFDPGVVAICLAAALFAFFAGWAAYHWTRTLEFTALRIILLTLLVPFLMFLALALIGGLSGFATAGALVAFVFLKFGLPFMLATLVWSSIFLYLQRKRSNSR